MRELALRKPPVLTRDDRADPPAREHDLEILGAVVREHRDAIAGAYSTIAQIAGEPAHAFAELSVRACDCAIDDGARARGLTRARSKQTRDGASRLHHSLTLLRISSAI